MVGHPYDLATGGTPYFWRPLHCSIAPTCGKAHRLSQPTWAGRQCHKALPASAPPRRTGTCGATFSNRSAKQGSTHDDDQMSVATEPRPWAGRRGVEVERTVARRSWGHPNCRGSAAPAGQVNGNGSRKTNTMAVDLVVGNFRLEVGLDNVWALSCRRRSRRSCSNALLASHFSGAVLPLTLKHHHTSNPQFSLPSVPAPVGLTRHNCGGQEFDPGPFGLALEAIPGSWQIATPAISLPPSGGFDRHGKRNSGWPVIPQGPAVLCTTPSDRHLWSHILRPER